MSLDPRTRLFLSVALFALIVSAGDPFDFGVLSLVVLALLLAGGRSLKTLLVRLAALAWLALLVGYFSLGPGGAGGWGDALASVWRLALLVALALALGSWFSPDDLVTVLAAFNRRGGRIGGLVNRFALTAGLTWRMLPEIALETRRVYLVRKLQGVFPRAAAYFNPAAWMTVLAPSVRRTMIRGRRTSFALAVRGFEPDAPRTSMTVLRFGRFDLVALLCLGLLAAFAVAT